MTYASNTALSARMEDLLDALAEEFPCAGVIILAAIPADDIPDTSIVMTVTNVDEDSFREILDQVVTDETGGGDPVNTPTLN
ncbi:hypothetical protein KXR64_16965 [Brucella intermedia]|uniref:hypothetical protein n=1 Tax=Brucella TaxID=234 RepID=UPI00094616D9|nr:hypothetical protein [Brucella intermedia]